MSYNDVIKQLESIGIEIDYTLIEVKDLNSECEDVQAFEALLRHASK